MPTENGFSFDGLVNRLRIGSARLALEVRDLPAIYIAFDMLANSKNLLGSPFRLRRKPFRVPAHAGMIGRSNAGCREVKRNSGRFSQQVFMAMVEYKECGGQISQKAVLQIA